MSMRLLPFALGLGLALASLVHSIHVANPSQEQLPLIARPGTPFEWSLRPDTFSPQPASLAASNLPAWLAFDVASLAFNGIPPAEVHFTGPLEPVQLLATAQDGQTVSDEIVFYVSTKPAPVVLHSIASQLRPGAPSLSSVFLLRPGSALAQTSNENSLRVPPGWSFSIGWRHDTFSLPVPYDEDDVYYTARLSNGLPLPGWLVYNTTALTFSGVAPKLESPSTFVITLYGGDAPGYNAISETFMLTIAAHEVSLTQLSIDALSLPINASANSPMLASLPVPQLLVDGQPLSAAEAQSVTVSLDADSAVGWLTFDAASLTLNGTPPRDFVGQTIIPLLITVPALAQTILTQVPLAVLPSAFSVSRIPLIWIKPGKKLSFDLGKYINPDVGLVIRDDALVMQTDSSQHASWLLFDSSKRVLEGKAPGVASKLEATFLATDSVTGSVSQTSITIVVSEDRPADANMAGVQDQGNDENSTDKPGATSSSGGKTDSKGMPSSGVSRSVIALIVGGLIAFVVLCLLAACCRRFCTARDDLESNTSSNAIHHIDFDAVRRASDEAARVKAGKPRQNVRAGWGIASLFGRGGGRNDEQADVPGIAVLVRTQKRREIDCDDVKEPYTAAFDEGWTCVPRDAGLTDDEKRARGYSVEMSAERVRRKTSLLARVLDRPWRTESMATVRHTRMVTLPGDSPGGYGVSHSVDSFRALNRQARDGSSTSLSSGRYEQPTRHIGPHEGSQTSLSGSQMYDLDPHELPSSGSGSTGSSSGLVGSPNSIPRQRLRSPLAHSQPYARSDPHTSPPDSFDSLSTTKGTGLAMNKPAEERRMFTAATHSNGSIRTAGGLETFTSRSFGDLYEEEGPLESGSDASTGALSGSAEASRPGTGSTTEDLRSSFGEVPPEDAASSASSSAALLSVPGMAMTGAPQIPPQAFSATTPVLATKPAYILRTHEDLRLVEKVLRSASAETAPKIPPIARHRQSMSLGCRRDVKVATSLAVPTQPLQFDELAPGAPVLLSAHDTYSGTPIMNSPQECTPVEHRDNRDTLGVPTLQPGQRDSSLSYLTTSSANEDDDDLDLERTEAARAALAMGRGTRTVL